MTDTIAMNRPVVFYDGGCPLCRREIAHYQRIDRERRIQWTDIQQEPHTGAVNLRIDTEMPVCVGTHHRRSGI